MDPTPTLFALLDATKAAETAPERRFILLNGTRDLLPYDVAIFASDGAVEQSGVSAVERHGPYGQWLHSLAGWLPMQASGPVRHLRSRETADEDGRWLPESWLWLRGDGGCGMLFVRHLPWSPKEQSLLQQWLDLWQLVDLQRAARAHGDAIVNWRALRSRVQHLGAGKRKTWAALALSLAALGFPVHLTVRAQAEIVPRSPTVVRAATEGIARRLLVEPNEAVSKGQLLAELDDAAAASRVRLARQALVTAEAEWRQTMQAALSDARAKAQLPAVQGRVEERRSELAFMSEQASRAEIRAPHDGVVLVDDPGNWAGRTVAPGEPLMKIAAVDDQEIEAWLPVADAIALDVGAEMRLFVASRPTQPLEGVLRSYGFEAQPRPDGSMAYRLRGAIVGSSRDRLGARGTAHIMGDKVPLAYWVARRPLAALREATGW